MGPVFLASFSNDCLILYTTIFLCLSPAPGTSGIRIMEMMVPQRVQAGERVTLACHFDLEGKTLYSLNWWRGSDQFYQFSPNSSEQKTVYHSPGITVDVKLSGRDEVVLRNVSQATAGKFKCEVLADYPSFEKDSEITDMEVVEVPKHQPNIVVRRFQWNPNDTLTANCTTQDVMPPPDIHWDINGEMVPSNYSHLVAPQPSDFHYGQNRRMNSIGFGYRTSQLTILLTPANFKAGQVTLTCVVSLPGLYRMSNDVILTLPGYRAASPSQKLYGSANPYLEPSSLLNILVTFVIMKFL